MKKKYLVDMTIPELLEEYKANNILLGHFANKAQMHRYDTDESGKETFQEAYKKQVRSSSYAEKIIDELEFRLFDEE